MSLILLFFGGEGGGQRGPGSWGYAFLFIFWHELGLRLLTENLPPIELKFKIGGKSSTNLLGYGYFLKNQTLGIAWAGGPVGGWLLTARHYLYEPKLKNNGPHIDSFLAQIIEPIWTQRLENIDPTS